MEEREEIFKEMADWPGYFVSNLGRILSCKRKIPKFLYGRLSRLGFPQVQVFQGSKATFLNVAREVLAAFYGYPADPWLCVARHKNGNLLDCSLENLEWVVCDTTEDYDPSKSLRKGILKPEHTKARMTAAKYKQSRETIEKAIMSRKKTVEYRRKFKEVNNLYSIQNRFKSDE